MATGKTKPAATKKPATKAATAAPKEPVVKIMVPTIDMAAVIAAGAEGEKRGPLNALKKKELVERVASAIGGKKKDVKEIVEATLAALGEALQKGEALHLPPFGHAKVSRSKGEGKESSMTVKLRGAGEKTAAKPRKEALAEVGEDS